MTKKKIRFTWLDAVLIALILAAVVFIVHRVGVEMRYRWQWPVILQYLVRVDGAHWAAGTLMQGFLTTVKLSLWAMVLATLLGTLMGLFRVSHGLFYRLIAGSYVEMVRNLPPLVLVFIVYFFIGERIMTLFGAEHLIRTASPETQKFLAFLFAPPARLSGFFAGLATLVLYEAAYITEIVRAGIQSIEKGQWEAAHALGLSRWQQLALRDPAAGSPEDTARPGGPAHLDDQRLRHRLGDLHPGAHLPGAGADVRHLPHLRGLDHHHGPLFSPDLYLLPGGQASGDRLAEMNAAGMSGGEK